MNKLFVFKTTEDQKNWVVSDFHLRHQGPMKAVHPLWESRGYASYGHMTDMIIAKTNELVGPNDNLWFLGDWCLNSTWAQFSEDLARFNCQNIYMLWGNHNSRVKEAYRIGMKEQYDIDDPNIEVYPVRYRNLIFVGEKVEIVVDGQYYVMCHFPIDIFNNGTDGAIMVCGHSHGSYEQTRVEYKIGKRLDVSWDCFKRPLLFSEVREICKHKENIIKDHHGKNQ